MAPSLSDRQVDPQHRGGGGSQVLKPHGQGAYATNRPTRCFVDRNISVQGRLEDLETEGESVQELQSVRPPAAVRGSRCG